MVIGRFAGGVGHGVGEEEEDGEQKYNGHLIAGCSIISEC
jgi:hypothetical protein